MEEGKQALREAEERLEALSRELAEKEATIADQNRLLEVLQEELDSYHGSNFRERLQIAIRCIRNDE